MSEENPEVAWAKFDAAQTSGGLIYSTPPLVRVDYPIEAPGQDDPQAHKAFMEHCRSCWVCRATLIDDCGYPGLCQPGLRCWTALSADDRADANETYREDDQ